LVRTDLQEFRDLSRSRAGLETAAHNAGLLVDIVRGPFLNELRYEDWAARMQTSVHAEVRDVLLPLATSQPGLSPDLRIRSATALIELDEFDDDAYIALARHLSNSGRQAAAREVIARYARRVESELADSPSPSVQAVIDELAPAFGRGNGT
jgi:DNA-binding SARP family transcriptional activator